MSKLPVGSNYVKVVRNNVDIKLQVVIPKNFLSTERMKKNLPRVMNEVKNDTYDFWVTLASQKLNKRRDIYVDNLFVKSTTVKNLVFELKQPATGIEQGYFKDMKPSYAASSKLKDKRKIKIPRHKRSELGKGPPAPTLIIPIDPARGIFRTFSLNQMNSNMWETTYKGVHIIPEVKKQLKTVIIPKRFAKFLKDSFK